MKRPDRPTVSWRLNHSEQALDWVLWASARSAQRPLHRGGRSVRTSAAADTPTRPVALSWAGSGDCDFDRYVDNADDSLWSRCLVGPGVSPPPNCLATDLDGDGDIDLHDAATFQSSFTGELDYLPVGRESLDADYDEDVDLRDFRLLQDVYSP